jgi:hypothetical protein
MSESEMSESDTAIEGGKRPQKPRNVDYTLEVVDDLPDLEVQRRSPLKDQISRITNTPGSHGQFVRIASYANGSAASAAANGLRKELGDTEIVDGWTVRTRRSDQEVNGVVEPRTGLFVRFNPDAVVPGERDAFNTRMKERAAKLDERRALRNDVEESVSKRSSKTK